MTQTIPGSAARSGVGETPAAAPTTSGGHLAAKALKAETSARPGGIGASDHAQMSHNGQMNRYGQVIGADR